MVKVSYLLKEPTNHVTLIEQLEALRDFRHTRRSRKGMRDSRLDVRKLLPWMMHRGGIAVEERLTRPRSMESGPKQVSNRDLRLSYRRRRRLVLKEMTDICPKREVQYMYNYWAPRATRCV